MSAAILVAVAGVSLVQRRGGAPPDGQAAPTALTSRRVDPPPEVWPFTNPSDDGRFVAGMVSETGDGAIVDLATNEFRPLGIGTDQSQGYASMGLMSHDGSTVAIDYHDDRGGNLYIARADGSRPRLLLEAPTDVTPHDWSRDGSMILGLVERPGRPTVIGLVAVSDGAVRALAEIGDVRPTHMTLSADNRYVAYDAPERPGTLDRDIFVLDAHAGESWPLEVSPGGDVGPFWTPDGRGLVFLSDRNRNPSLWLASVEQGRLQAPSELLKDGVGRVHLRGFTAAGALHYDLSAGFAEVFLASVDGSQPSRAEPLSPRRAVSNFYPHWSPNGRFVAYAAERSDLNATRAVRELWVYDITTRTEMAVPFKEPIGRPLGWSPDSREILIGGPNGGRLDVVDRLTGRARAITSDLEGRIAWGPAGILFGRKGKVVLVDPADGLVLREFGPLPLRELSLAPDGRSLIAKRPNGRLALLDSATGAAREWTDPVEWVGLHFMAPHTAGVAYMAGRKGVNGESRTLMYWGGGGDPREVLRVPGNDRFILVGWLPDGLTLLVARWENRPNRLPHEPDPSTLWRVPISGGNPVSTGLTMDGLRDVSIHPDGRHIAFNAGWKRGEQWVMEHLLPQTPH
jgi:Tol biopolymer transport system component